jgi:predicted small lipoprotein YifL
MIWASKGAAPLNRAVKMTFAPALLMAIAASGVGGCGRAGPLEPPPDAQAVAKSTDQSADNGAGGIPKPHQRPPAIQAPKQPFFLDFLL